MSHDLTYDLEHWNGALAKLVEQAALERPGVVVVELAEAEALGRELALAAQGSRIERPPPLYLIGNFRNETTGGIRKTTLNLRAERSGHPAIRKAFTVGAADAPAAVRQWAADSLDAFSRDSTPRPSTDARAESKQLAERARMHFRMANWVEALALAEAALLLEPDQPALQAEALIAITRHLLQNWRATGPEYTWVLKDAETMLRLRRRGLDHLEAFVAAGGKIDDYYRKSEVNHLLTIRSLCLKSQHLAGYPPGLEALVAPERAHQREVISRVLERVTRNHEACDGQLASWLLDGLPPAEQSSRQRELILKYQDLPGASARTKRFLSGWTIPRYVDSPDYRAALDVLAKEGNQHVREAIAEIQAKLDQPAGVVETPAVPVQNTIRLRPVPVQIVDRNGLKPFSNSLFRLRGIEAIGPGVDVLWSTRNLYVMTNKDEATPLPHDAQDQRNITDVCYDGRYAWAALRGSTGGTSLFLLDPKSKRTTDVSATEGLPQFTAEEWRRHGGALSLTIAPLGPGRVCVAGACGRTWIAEVKYDDTAKKPEVTMLLEAREVPSPTDSEQGNQTRLAFVPGSLIPLRYPMKGVERLLAVRSGSSLLMQENKYNPLIIDLKTRDVSVLQPNLLRKDGVTNVFFGEAETGAFRIVWSRTSGVKPQLTRIDSRGQVSVPIQMDYPGPVGRLIQIGDRLHLLRMQTPPQVKGQPAVIKSNDLRTDWWLVDPATGKCTLAAKGLPHVGRVTVSSHYGLVAIREYGDPAEVLNLVDIASPAANP